MPLPDIVGHEELRKTLHRALAADGLPQSLLIHGPAGAGKERLGLWLAQLIVCENRGPEPCGTCPACRSALRLEHPDVHWFFPLPRPDAPSPEKLRDKLEELRAAELQLWRHRPLRVPDHEKAPAHFLASVRTMLRLASLRPASSSRSVFVVGDAELMVPQESSPEAANAFLKLLEEPPPYATVILTSSQPGALLPTIRSRVLALRAQPVPERGIARLLSEGGLADEETAAAIAKRARGSVRRAILLAGMSGDVRMDPERLAGRDLLMAALNPDAGPRFLAAHKRKPAGARADLVGELESLALWLRDLAAVATGAVDSVDDPEIAALLHRAVDRRRITAIAASRAMRHVTVSRELALGNVNPQLIVADLLRKIQLELVGGVRARGRGEI